MAQNSINNRSSQLTIDPITSSDSYINYDINATNKFAVGNDVSQSDSFCISKGSDLSTNDYFKILPAGARRCNTSCAAKFTNSTHADAITGDGTTYTMVFDAVTIDQNSNLSTFTTFTAPVDGIYFASACLRAGGTITSGMTEAVLQLTGPTTQKSLTSEFSLVPLEPPVQPFTVSLNGFLSLSASDTVILQFTVSGGTKTVNSRGRRDSSYMSFYLIG